MHSLKNILDDIPAPLAAVALLLGASVAVVSADSGGAFTHLEEAMSEEAFAAAGLHRLEPEELAYLNQWLRRRAPAIARPAPAEVAESEPDAVEAEAAFGLEQVERDQWRGSEAGPEEIRSRIEGSFEGWSGNTVFRLENGQVWRQSGPGTFHHRAENPAVVIRRAMLGSYLLRVEGKNTTVRVRRVE